MTFTGKLYPYQEDIVDKMVDRGKVLVALVMGGGKTICAIATIEDLIEHDDIDRALIVVPTSLKYQWQKEIAKFTRNTRTVVIDGPAKRRVNQWKAARMAQYVIVNPEVLVNDLNHVRDLPIECMVVDEASMMKNPGSKRSKMLKRFARRVEFRYALTGTPVENRPEELYSIMQMVDATVLGSADVFDNTFIVRDHFGKPIRYRNLGKLKERLSPAMVRLSREDIADQLPAIVQQHIEVDLDTNTAELYNELSLDLLAEIRAAMKQMGGGFDLWGHYGEKDAYAKEIQGTIMAKMTSLRMLCDNPRIIRKSAELWAEQKALCVGNEKPKQGSEQAAKLMANGMLDGIDTTPKLDACVELIEQILDEDPSNKVVLFSFFIDNLEEIQKATAHITQSVQFKGAMNAKQREDAKDQFRKDKNTRLFLSSDAGGYGVDLPMANYLISYDLPWSAGKLDQREARIIRASSEFKSVTLISLVVRGSIEQWQYEMVTQKRDVGSAFVDGKYRGKKGHLDVTLATLSEFLARPLLGAAA